MPSRKRIWYPGAVYHVMGRGIRQMVIYKKEEDYEIFLAILEAVKKEMGFDLYAICLMSNHFHILLKTQDTEIWKIMAKLMFRYARTYNVKYGYHGHLFDSRYASKLVEDNRYMLEVSRYIHLNPVKARMVNRPEDYPYSNYNFYSGLHCEKTEGKKMEGIFSGLTEGEAIQTLFSHDKERLYREFVEGKAGHMESEVSIRNDMGEDENWLPW